MAVIGVTESWLDASVTDSEIYIADYTIIRRDRNREGGGVCIYKRRDFIFKLRDDICTTLETAWAELYLPKTKPILIWCMLPSTQASGLFNTLEQCCLHCNCFTNKEIVMMGDCNIDYSQMHCHTNQLHVSLKHVMSMTQLINTSSTTSTILDLILISDPAKISITMWCIRPWLKRSPSNILYTQMQENPHQSS